MGIPLLLHRITDTYTYFSTEPLTPTLTSPQNKIVTGATVTLTCASTGADTYKFQKDPNQDLTSFQASPTYNLGSFDDSKDGVYTCVGKNDRAQSAKSAGLALSLSMALSYF